jgi:hypothetical protein
MLHTRVGGVMGAFTVLTLFAMDVFGAAGTIFYNSSSGSPAMSVRATGADGSNPREIPLTVPSPAFPTVSRDGRSLLVTSGGPLASVMLSQNVFHIDLATGVTVPISHYIDTTSDGITIYTNDLGKTDFNTYSYYTTHLPIHKAFSPNGDRVALLDLSAVSGRQPGGVRLAAVQSPVLEVFPVQQTFPIGNRLITGAERTSVNQAGDGLDWHPAREELVGAFRADIPSSGNLGESKTEGTVLMVFATSGARPLLRMLTQPTGRSYYDFNAFYILSETEQDYAPAISRDGSKVAYVRNTLASDTRVDAGIRLAKCAIRIINYDGSGDRELVSFGNNLWITKVTWSPDDTELAFDIAPRLVVNGLELQMGDSTRSEIHIVRTSNASIRLLASAPAAYPSWSALGSAPAPAPAPQLRAARAGNQINLELTNLSNGRQVDLETTTDLVRWTPWQTITPSGATHQLAIPMAEQHVIQFLRARAR